MRNPTKRIAAMRNRYMVYKLLLLLCLSIIATIESYTQSNAYHFFGFVVVVAKSTTKTWATTGIRAIVPVSPHEQQRQKQTRLAVETPFFVKSPLGHNIMESSCPYLKNYSYPWYRCLLGFAVGKTRAAISFRSRFWFAS
jgi:hypothetical protein